MTYNYNNQEYFFKFENGVLTVNENVIKCTTCHGYAIKINKKSVGADAGAEGVYKFVCRCIQEKFALCYVNKIIDLFCK